MQLDRKLVVFNIQSLEEELQGIGTHLIATFVWNQVRRSKRPTAVMRESPAVDQRAPDLLSQLCVIVRIL